MALLVATNREADAFQVGFANPLATRASNPVASRLPGDALHVPGRVVGVREFEAGVRVLVCAGRAPRNWRFALACNRR